MFVYRNVLSMFPIIFCTNSMFEYAFYGAYLWVSFFLFCIFNFRNNFLSHLVPFNTPSFLLHFMVTVELVRSFIRPLTLAIRLMANVTAGHLILGLISCIIPTLSTYSVVIVPAITLIIIMELSVGLIQGYIYTALLLLYFSDLRK